MQHLAETIKDKRWQVGRCKIRYSRRNTKGMGRFGGGWQWKLGIMAGNLSRKRGEVIVSLLVSDVRISWGY